MHVQHDLRRLGFVLVEELFEDVDHEFHGGVVVIVQDDLVSPWLPGRRLLDDAEVALFFPSPVRVLCHRQRETLYTAEASVEPARPDPGEPRAMPRETVPCRVPA